MHKKIISMVLGALTFSILVQSNSQAARFYCSAARYVVAASNGDLNMVQKCFANVGRADAAAGGMTPLIAATKKGHVDVIAYLLKKGARPTIGDEQGDAAIQFSQEPGKQYVTITALLMRYGANPNFANSWGSTPLIEAARKGLVTNVFLLLSKKNKHPADPNLAKGGKTALWYLIKMGKNKPTIIKALADAGANFNYIYPDGKTALLNAVIQGDATTVSALLAVGASPNIPAKNGLTAFHYAISLNKNAEEIVNLLLKHKGDINKPNNAGLTPLMLAVVMQKPQAVKVLLKNGANKNLKTQKGMTAMDYAKNKGNQDIIWMLKI